MQCNLIRILTIIFAGLVQLLQESMDRKKEFDVRNFVKQQRLGSLGNPRDLSLGGTKNKKVYVPNLNAVRTKNKTKE